jgi:hypothetical protein
MGWPPDSVEEVDADGITRHVRYVRTPPPTAPEFADLAVEVKTWSTSTWASHGLHVAADQLLRILEKAEVISWCRVVGHIELLRPVRGRVAVVDPVLPAALLDPREVAPSC